MTDPMWEYFELRSFEGDDNRQKKLTALGADGWEMVSAVYKPTGSHLTVFYFKRQMHR